MKLINILIDIGGEEEIFTYNTNTWDHLENLYKSYDVLTSRSKIKISNSMNCIIQQIEDAKEYFAKGLDFIENESLTYFDKNSNLANYVEQQLTDCIKLVNDDIIYMANKELPLENIIKLKKQLGHAKFASTLFSLYMGTQSRDVKEELLLSRDVKEEVLLGIMNTLNTAQRYIQTAKEKLEE